MECIKDTKNLIKQLGSHPQKDLMHVLHQSVEITGLLQM